MQVNLSTFSNCEEAALRFEKVLGAEIEGEVYL